MKIVESLLNKKNMSDNEQIHILTEDWEEEILDVADAFAESTVQRLLHEEVFEGIRNIISYK